MTVYRVVSLKRWRAVAAGLVAVALLAGAWAGLRGAAAVPAEAANGTVCLPILMYHGVLEDPGRQGLYVVSPALLESDLLTVMQACTNGTLDKTEVKFSDGAAACVVLASGGYPVAYEKGKEITGLENGQVPGAADVTVYHAGTAIKDGKLVTNGGRVLGVTATAATLPEALKKAYAAADCIHFDKLHRRSDIGARALAAMKAQEG